MSKLTDSQARFVAANEAAHNPAQPGARAAVTRAQVAMTQAAVKEMHTPQTAFTKPAKEKK